MTSTPWTAAGRTHSGLNSSSDPGNAALDVSEQPSPFSEVYSDVCWSIVSEKHKSALRTQWKPGSERTQCTRQLAYWTHPGDSCVKWYRKFIWVQRLWYNGESPHFKKWRPNHNSEDWPSDEMFLTGVPQRPLVQHDFVTDFLNSSFSTSPAFYFSL